MQKLDAVVEHLKKIGPDFYGQVIIRIRRGQAVLITEERNIKLDDDQENGNTKVNDKNQRI